MTWMQALRREGVQVLVILNNVTGPCTMATLQVQDAVKRAIRENPVWFHWAGLGARNKRPSESRTVQRSGFAVAQRTLARCGAQSVCSKEREGQEAYVIAHGALEPVQSLARLM